MQEVKDSSVSFAAGHFLENMGKSFADDSRGDPGHFLKILVVSQHYWPEPFAVSDVCEGLVSRGHSVTVLTGIPNYPDGDVYPDYDHATQSLQERNGVRIVRVRLIPRGRDFLHRVANYYSFSLNASRVARAMREKYDVVLSFQMSPIMMSEPALVYGRSHGVPVLLWCQDLWPESLTAGGIKRGSFIYEFYSRVSKRIYSAANRLAVSSASFEKYFKEQLGMTDCQTVYLPQYAEDVFHGEALPRDGYDSGKINLTFAGNIGMAQAVDTLVEAGWHLQGDPRFSLHVVGSGSELEALKKRKEDIGAGCVTFHGRFPLDDMPSFYASSDAMVATFRDSPILGYTLPRKIVSYMAAGRPILGTVTGEARRVIEEARCGLCCDAEDSLGLARICREFAEMTPEAREAMGANGKRYYEEHFAKERFFATLEEELWKLKESRT